MQEFGFLDDQKNVATPYDIFTVEEIKALQELGRQGGSN